jgi:two-component system, response regulator YesN
MQIGLFIVDDDGWIINGLKSIINWEDYGFKIIGEASDGFTAQDKIQELKPDLVITDIMMPELSGLEMMLQLASKNIKPEFVVLSGYAEFAYAKEACKLGAFDYLLKPLEEEVLLDTLERFKQKFYIMNDVEELPVNMVSIPKTTSNKTLNRILSYINANYSSKLHLYEIAEQFHFNTNYISQLFSKELGISFSEYVTQYRMDMAEKLLLESNAPVKVICSQVGIGDYFYFNRLFKKYKMVTPNQLRVNRGQTPGR